MNLRRDLVLRLCEAVEALGQFRRQLAPLRPRAYRLAVAFYLGAGVFVFAWSIAARDRIEAFLGLLTLGVALAVYLAAKAMVRAGGQLTHLTRSVLELRILVAQLRQAELKRGPTAQEPKITTIDLASLGSGDPGAVTAATLDRAAFPRLVRTMEDRPTPTAGTTPARTTERQQAGAREASTTGVTARDLVNEWNAALRAGDLIACRRLHATLVDTAPPETVAPLTILLKTLGKHVERTLRDNFARCVHEHDYAGALRIGEQICALFPGECISRDFERIKPHLTRRVV